jgi:Ca-activated chloride channel homolog
LGQITQEIADKAVLKTALDHQIVSSLTSLIAVDHSPKRPAGYVLTRADVPLNLPSGWVWESVFGADVPAQNVPHTDQKAQGEFIQLAKLETAKPPAPPAQVNLPQGATDAEMMGLIGFILAMLALIMQFFARRKSVQA